MENKVLQQRIETFKVFGETLKGAKVYFREDWGVLYFDLQGKMFGMMSKLWRIRCCSSGLKPLKCSVRR